MQREQHAYKGAFLNASGFLFLALASAGVKHISGTVPTIIIVFSQSLICLLLTSPLIVKYGIHNLKTSHSWLHLARDFGGLFCFLTFFASLKTLPLVNATLLFNAAPLWMPFILFFWLKVKFRRDLWLGIILGFIGIMFILRPHAGFFHVGTLYALISGMLLGFTLICVRVLSKTEPTLRILFYYFLVMTLATLPFAWYEWVPLSRTYFLMLIAIGVSVWLSQFIITLSFKYAKASTLAPVSYLSVVYAGILDWLIWHHIPAMMTVMGIILVIIGGIITLFRERKMERQIG